MFVMLSIAIITLALKVIKRASEAMFQTRTPPTLVATIGSLPING